MANYTPGAGALWAQKTTDEIPTQFASSAGGLTAAQAYLAPGGVLQMPDLALALGASWANIGLILFDATGKVYMSRFRVADGADPTKRVFFDPAAVATATERTVTLPNWSGLMPLPTDGGVLGTFLRSGGAGVQPTWASVPAATNNLLDGTNHLDTVAQAVLRGALVVGNSTPKWDRLAVGAANTVLFSNGTDPSWATVASLTALLEHTNLLRLLPFAVANATWAAGSTSVTSAGGFGNVRVGDYINLGDNTTAVTQGAKVQTKTDNSNLVMDRTNTGAAIGPATFVFQPSDHFDNALTVDSNGVGAGLLMTLGRGTYTTTGGGTYQELRGPIRWQANASGTVRTDFDVQGADSTVTPSGFCVRRQGTTNRAYWYANDLTANRTYKLPNIDGFTLVLTDGAQNILTKTFQSGNTFWMQESSGAGNGCIFADPTNTSKKLYFNLTGLTNPSDRIATWQDRSGTVAYTDDIVGGVYAPGSKTFADGAYGVHVKQLRLTSTQRLTMAGDSRLVIMC